MATKPLKTLTFEGLNDTYTVPQVDSTLSVTGKAADAKVTGDTLADKADKDGVIATAEGLIGGAYTTEKEPYHFRKTAVDLAGRLDETIVGGSLGWNQLIDNADFKTNTTVTKNGITIEYSPTAHTFTIKAGGTATAATSFFLTNPMNDIPVGHKVLITGLPREFNSGTELFINVYNKSGSNQFYRNMISPVIVGTGNQSFISIFIRSGFSVASDIVLKPQCIDLTILFGTTIADYIYSLEQSTAEAGVAWVKRYIDLDTYHEYDAGSIQSVEGLQSHDVVGFNQWDEEWELGSISTADGSLVQTTNRIRSKNFIKVLPNTQYYICKKNELQANVFYLAYYDADENFISVNVQGTYNVVVTTPTNAQYMKFWIGSNAYPVTTYNHDICINLSDPSRNGTYEPYEKHSYPLDPTVKLNGVFKLVGDHLEADGDRWYPNKGIERRYRIVDLGTFNWSLAEDHVFYNMVMNNKVRKNQGVFCSKYANPYTVNTRLSNMTDKTVQNRSDTDVLYIKDSDYSDAATFKTAVSGVYLVYELVTPTTETAQPFQSPMIVGATEEYVSDSVVPVGHESRYYEDIIGKVNDLPSDFSTLIAPVEKSFTATRNYTVGSFVIVNNQLYKVTSAISSGGTITPNSNCTATTIMAEILALA